MLRILFILTLVSLSFSAFAQLQENRDSFTKKDSLRGSLTPLRTSDDVRYYHKYTKVTNDKKEETDWIKVKETSFEKYENDIGNEIITKPYGKYEDEKNEVAAPPGYNYVGNRRYDE